MDEETGGRFYIRSRGSRSRWRRAPAEVDHERVTSCLVRLFVADISQYAWYSDMLETIMTARSSLYVDILDLFQKYIFAIQYLRLVIAHL